MSNYVAIPKEEFPMTTILLGVEGKGRSFTLLPPSYCGLVLKTEVIDLGWSTPNPNYTIMIGNVPIEEEKPTETPMGSGVMILQGQTFGVQMNEEGTVLISFQVYLHELKDE